MLWLSSVYSVCKGMHGCVLCPVREVPVATEQMFMFMGMSRCLSDYLLVYVCLTV